MVLREPMNLVVTNALGQHIYRSQTSPGEAVLDVHGWPTGVYTLHASSVANSMSLETVRVVVKH